MKASAQAPEVVPRLRLANKSSARSSDETREGPDFSAQGLANTLWAMATANRVLPEIFDSLRRAAAANVQAFDAQGLANAL